MNQKSLILAAILAATALSVVATPLAVFADESETDTDQEVYNKNIGSGDAVQNNCGQNLIKAGADDNCEDNN
jgi:uncharacterized membrane protein